MKTKRNKLLKIQTSEDNYGVIIVQVSLKVHPLCVDTLYSGSNPLRHFQNTTDPIPSSNPLGYRIQYIFRL